MNEDRTAKQGIQTGNHLDGILVIDKPAGPTSHDVVARVRRLLRTKRVGHTGTLDPFATGVLVVPVGRATRLSQFLVGAEKEYEALIRLGYTTDSGDFTGARLEESSPPSFDCSTLDRERIEAALAPLRGEIEQVPPMYSAKKVRGVKLYEMARRGEVIEREAVRVRVGAFDILDGEDGALAETNEDGTCDLRAHVTCSAGTYVRTLAEAFGRRLGVGAHLAALRRTRAGTFRIESAVTLEELQRLADEGRTDDALLRIEAALPEMAFAHLSVDESRRARHGAAVKAAGAWDEGERVRLLDEAGRLLAVAVYDRARGVLQPRVMLATDENKY